MCHFTQQPAGDLVCFYKNIDEASNSDFVAPCLMAHGNLLQLEGCEVKVIQVQAALRLETPSHGADEFVVEALLFHLVEEESNPGLQHSRTDLQVLQAKGEHKKVFG